MVICKGCSPPVDWRYCCPFRAHARQCFPPWGFLPLALPPSGTCMDYCPPLLDKNFECHIALHSPTRDVNTESHQAVPPTFPTPSISSWCSSTLTLLFFDEEQIHPLLLSSTEEKICMYQRLCFAKSLPPRTASSHFASTSHSIVVQVCAS